MGWLADCSESERAAVLAKLAGRAYLSEQDLKDAQNQIKMKRKKAILVKDGDAEAWVFFTSCLLYTSPSPRDGLLSRMPSSA